MKIQSIEVMKQRIATGKYCITKAYEPDNDKAVNGYVYYISSGSGRSMTFKDITPERAQEWIDLGAEVILL